jgi:RNA polymerase sigma-70 factor, ECF subfamily
MTPAAARPVETDLVTRIRAGDARAYAELFDQYYVGLCHYAASINPAGGAAEEAVQEVLLKVWLRRDRLPPVMSLGGYLYASVRNHCLNQVRRDRFEESWRHRRVAEMRDGPPMAASADADVRTAELSAAIEAALEKLPPRCRQAFLLQRRERMRVAEIAAAMQIAPKTVEIHIGNALKLLRSLLAEWRPRD